MKDVWALECSRFLEGEKNSESIMPYFTLLVAWVIICHEKIISAISFFSCVVPISYVIQIGGLRTLFFLFRLQPNMKCIIFVNRIVTARSLSYILQNLRFLCSWKCGFLLGVHSGLKSMSRKNTSIILEKFRSGEVTLPFLVVSSFGFSKNHLGTDFYFIW